MKRENQWGKENFEAMLKSRGLTPNEYRQVIKEDLQRYKLIDFEVKSKIIISDRSFISSLAYQEPADWIEVLNKYAKKPDLLILLDLDVKKSVSRTSGEDTFENEEFLTGVRENYLKIAKNYNHEIIDANNGVNKVSSDIKKAVAPYLGICPDCIQ